MKFSYLLLSVLVVCVIGVMVPSVFAEEPCAGGPLHLIPPGMLPCGGTQSYASPLTPEERCIKNNECMIKVTIDKQIYQSDETINITVELIGMDYFGVENYPMLINVRGSGESSHYSCILTNTVSMKEKLCHQYVVMILE